MAHSVMPKDIYAKWHLERRKRVYLASMSPDMLPAAVGQSVATKEREAVEFHSRLKAAFRARDTTQTEVERSLFDRVGDLASMKKRKSLPTLGRLRLLSEHLDVDFTWLGTGVGHMDAHKEQRARYPLAQKAVEMFGPTGNGRWTEETCRGLLRVALKEKSGDLEDVKAWRAIGDMLQKSLYEEIGKALTEEDDEELGFGG